MKCIHWLHLEWRNFKKNWSSVQSVESPKTRIKGRKEERKQSIYQTRSAVQHFFGKRAKHQNNGNCVLFVTPFSKKEKRKSRCHSIYCMYTTTTTVRRLVKHERFWSWSLHSLTCRRSVIKRGEMQYIPQQYGAMKREILVFTQQCGACNKVAPSNVKTILSIGYTWFNNNKKK